jgi:hypothetical protein
MKKPRKEAVGWVDYIFRKKLAHLGRGEEPP